MYVSIFIPTCWISSSPISVWAITASFPRRLCEFQLIAPTPISSVFSRLLYKLSHIAKNHESKKRIIGRSIVVGTYTSFTDVQLFFRWPRDMHSHLVFDSYLHRRIAWQRKCVEICMVTYTTSPQSKPTMATCHISQPHYSRRTSIILLPSAHINML